MRRFLAIFKHCELERRRCRYFQELRDLQMHFASKVIPTGSHKHTPDQFFMLYLQSLFSIVGAFLMILPSFVLHTSFVLTQKILLRNYRISLSYFLINVNEFSVLEDFLHQTRLENKHQSKKKIVIYYRLIICNTLCVVFGCIFAHNHPPSRPWLRTIFLLAKLQNGAFVRGLILPENLRSLSLKVKQTHFEFSRQKSTI